MLKQITNWMHDAGQTTDTMNRDQVAQYIGLLCESMNNCLDSQDMDLAILLSVSHEIVHGEHITTPNAVLLEAAAATVINAIGLIASMGVSPADAVDRELALMRECGMNLDSSGHVRGFRSDSAGMFVGLLEDKPVHDSDCATHNEPAYPAGECDCRVSQDLETANANAELLTTSVADLEMELERLREQTQWRPIESAPKDGTEIMGFSDCGELIPKMCWKHHYWFNGNPATKKSWGSEGPFPTPTHWMPLPAPPK